MITLDQGGFASDWRRATILGRELLGLGGSALDCPSFCNVQVTTKAVYRDLNYTCREMSYKTNGRLFGFIAPETT